MHHTFYHLLTYQSKDKRIFRELDADGIGLFHVQERADVYSYRPMSSLASATGSARSVSHDSVSLADDDPPPTPPDESGSSPPPASAATALTNEHLNDLSSSRDGPPHQPAASLPSTASPTAHPTHGFASSHYAFAARRSMASMEPIDDDDAPKGRPGSPWPGLEPLDESSSESQPDSASEGDISLPCNPENETPACKEEQPLKRDEHSANSANTDSQSDTDSESDSVSLPQRTEVTQPDPQRTAPQPPAPAEVQSKCCLLL
jgi:hypothetical protein